MKGRWFMLALLIAVLSIAGVALLSPGLRDRVLHPARYATTGAEQLDADRYAAAAQAVARAGERVAQLRLPDAGDGPVTVALAGATERIVYLDPPTARVLDVVAIAAEPGARAMERPVTATRLTAAAAIHAAEALAHGEVRRLSWPTERKPDWIVGFAGNALVAVADDAGVAVVMPTQATAQRDGGFGWRLIALGALVTGLIAAAMWWRMRRSARVDTRFTPPLR